MIEFQGWPKTPRLFRDMVVTEKIDGTNAAVIIEEVQGDLNIAIETAPDYAVHVITHGSGAPDFEGSTVYLVAAQSRTRMITPDADNFGFAAWVWDNAEALVDVLGEGRHFGEWWGSGIQRGYGLPKGDKRFSLFNTKRYADQFARTLPDDFLTNLGLDTVPVLYEGKFDLIVVDDALGHLAHRGSKAAPGFMRPEGVVVYHTAANAVFKATIDNDAAPKSAT